jgi:hypothetical protein
VEEAIASHCPPEENPISLDRSPKIMSPPDANDYEAAGGGVYSGSRAANDSKPLGPSSSKVELIDLPMKLASTSVLAPLTSTVESKAGRANLLATVVIPATDAKTVVAAASPSSFSLAVFSSVIDEGDPLEPVRFYTDRELNKIMDGISNGMQAGEDWQERVRCLQLLQKLCLTGDLAGGVFETQFLQSLRGIWDAVSVLYIYCVTPIQSLTYFLTLGNSANNRLALSNC